MRNVLFPIGLLFCTCCAVSSVAFGQWAATYGGNNEDRSSGSRQASDGGYCRGDNRTR